VAGANKILKAGQVVFKAGDAADGMYLVRKGELVVYLEQDSKEVILAKIGEGGMIGEMALFDRQARSASVKASIDSEVTLISLDDFTKLMKQIPKWFVGLMSALSGRLRTTNDRLKQMEASSAASVPAAASASTLAKPYQNLLRMVYILELMWHRDGTKEGKDWCLQRKLAEDTLVSTFGEPLDRVKTLINILATEQIVSLKNDQYKNPVLALSNRGALRQFADFINGYVSSNASKNGFSTEKINVLKVLQKLGAGAPYEQYTCTPEDILEAAKEMNLDASVIEAAVRSFGSAGDAVKTVKTSTKSGIGLKVTKADFPAVMKNIGMISKINAAKLDQ